MSLRRDAYWTAVDTFISSGLAFVLRLIVARVLSPDDFGIAAIAITIVTVLQVVNDFGLTSALIQRDEEEVTRDLVNTTFTASLAITILLAAGTALVAAPWAASFYDQPSLQPLILVLALSLLPSPFNTVSAAMLYREQRFRDVAVIRVVSTVVGLITALVLLLIDPTPWVIILQVVVANVVAAIGMQIASGWRYALTLKKEFLEGVFRFSGLIFLNDLAVIFSANAGVFILGRVLSVSDAGLFAMAVYLTDMVRKVLTSILNRVTFVHYSKNKRDSEAMRSTYLSTLLWNCRVIFPAMAVFALFGPAIMVGILGAEWASMGSVIVWLSLSVMIHCAGGTTSTLFKAIGRPGLDLTLFLTTNLCLLIPGMILGARYFGVEGVAIATAATKLISVLTRQIVLGRKIPGITPGVLRTVGAMLFRQWPIVLAWALFMLVPIGPTWFAAALFAACGGAVYAVLELPRAFPGEIEKLRGMLRKRRKKAL